MSKTMKVKEALKYLEGAYALAQNELSDEQKHWMDCRHQNPVDAIMAAKEVIEKRFYCEEHDEKDYIVYTNMLVILDNHYKITKALNNGMVRGNTLVQISITNC